MKFSNNFNLPENVVSALTADDYDYDGDPRTFSATTIINPPKISLIRRRHGAGMEMDVSDKIWSFFGTAVHAAFEKKSIGGEKEKRIYVPAGGLKISGKPDNFCTEAKTLHDYKVTSVWSLVFGKEEWDQQVNVYAWLIRKGLGVSIQKAELILILRDWIRSKAAREADYPQIPLAVVNVAIWPDEKQDAYMQSRIDLYEKYVDVPDDEIPYCTPEERWAKAGTFAIMKNDNKRALKVLPGLHDAQNALLNFQKDTKNAYRIEERPGDDTIRCQYCPVGKNGYCKFFTERNLQYGKAESDSES